MKKRKMKQKVIHEDDFFPIDTFDWMDRLVCGDWLEERNRLKEADLLRSFKPVVFASGKIETANDMYILRIGDYDSLVSEFHIETRNPRYNDYSITIIAREIFSFLRRILIEERMTRFSIYTCNGIIEADIIFVDEMGMQGPYTYLRFTIIDLVFTPHKKDFLQE